MRASKKELMENDLFIWNKRAAGEFVTGPPVIVARFTEHEGVLCTGRGVIRDNNAKQGGNTMIEIVLKKVLLRGIEFF